MTGRRARRFERRILRLLSALGILALICGAWLLWLLPASVLVRGVLIVMLAMLVTALCVYSFKAAVEPMRSLTSVVAAYRDGDYTIRCSGALGGDTLGSLAREINNLGETLLGQRLRAMEATALLDKLIAAIDVAVLAFDGEAKLRLLNPVAARLLDLQIDTAMGKSAAELGLAELLATPITTHVSTSLAGRVGRWQVTHGTFRDEGISQHLLIVADVQQVLRQEERSAWQRLIRVIGHEINNSLTPIKSLADTLHGLLGDALPGGPARDDALPALQVIAERSATLQRFIAQYSRLARLPPPKRRWIRVAPLLTRVASLEPQRDIQVSVPQDLEVYVDEDQLEQALINLVRNAAEAHGGVSGRIVVAAECRNTTLAITVTDQGPGIANPDNLFVPFFTTKPGGSGVGLLLSRQIAEAHGGTLSLANRPQGNGAIAQLHLPDAIRRTA